jgi:hypothetical protein
LVVIVIHLLSFLKPLPLTAVAATIPAEGWEIHTGKAIPVAGRGGL